MSETSSLHHRSTERLMPKRWLIAVLLIIGACWMPMLASPVVIAQTDDYLQWNARQAEAIGNGMREKGRVGSFLGFRGLHTERAGNYKLRATWLTPDVIRATARLLQLSNRLTDEQTKSLVAEAEAAGDTVVLVEIDPREGSGVIPLEWQAFLQPKGLRAGDAGAVTGINTSKLRDVKALVGVAKRDYDYDVFWIVFPLLNEQGKPTFSDAVREAELVVRIYDKEGKVSWPIPDSIRKRMAHLATKSPQ
jgi:hypothetical protein